MTKEQQIALYGIEIPDNYAGWVIREPMWPKEHFLAALEIAKAYNYDLKEEKDEPVA